MGAIFRYADTIGDGTGATQANVNGSVTPVVFKCGPRVGEKRIDVHRMLIFIEDSGSFDSSSYGNGISMSNGIEVGVYYDDGTQIQDLLDGKPIQINPDWSRVCYDTALSAYGQGDETLTVRWTFDRTGTPITLGAGTYIGITINDDLTGLIDHTFQLQGNT